MAKWVSSIHTLLIISSITYVNFSPSIYSLSLSLLWLEYVFDLVVNYCTCSSRWRRRECKQQLIHHLSLLRSPLHLPQSLMASTPTSWYVLKIWVFINYFHIYIWKVVFFLLLSVQLVHIYDVSITNFVSNLLFMTQLPYLSANLSIYYYYVHICFWSSFIIHQSSHPINAFNSHIYF